MELVLVAAAAVALGLAARMHPAPSVGPLDTYSAWLMRHQKPAIHR